MKDKARMSGVTEWMSSQHPTPKQLAFLAKLGNTETPRDRAHASVLIDSLLKDQAVTYE